MKKTYTKLTVLSALPMALLSCLLLFGTTTATAQNAGCPSTNFNYCPVANDDQSWLFQADPVGGGLSLTFNGGFLETGWDYIRIYDGVDATAPVLLDTDGALSGTTVVSTSGNLFVQVDTDGGVQCSSNSTTYSPLDFDVFCGVEVVPGCTDVNALNYNVDATTDDGSCVTPTCQDPSLNVTYCPGPNDATEWLFVGLTPTDNPAVLFNGGIMESCCDDITIYDGTTTAAPILFNGTGNLTGTAVISTSGNLLIVVDTDVSGQCSSNSTTYAPLDFDVFCGVEVVPGCTDVNALNYNVDATTDDGSCVTPTCQDPSLNVTYCPGPNDATEFLFTGTTGSDNPAVLFNAGTMESNFDDITIYDGTSNTDPVLFSGDGNLSGTAVISTSGNLLIVVDTDGSNQCSSGGQTELDFDIFCGVAVVEGCTDPTAINFNPDATTDDGSCIATNCQDPAVNYTYCYDNNESTTFVYGPSSPGALPSLYINAGTFESCCDDITIYDGDNTSAPTLLATTGGDVSGTFVESTSGFLLIEINSDGSSSCGSGSQTSLDYNVSCGVPIVPGCTDPTALNYNPNATDDDGSCIIPNCPTATNVTFCYGDNADDQFVYEAAVPGDQPILVINSGVTESCCDDITIYDGNTTTAPVLYNGAGDQAGVTVQSTSGSLLLQFQSDGSVSCAGTGTTPTLFDYDVYDGAAETCLADAGTITADESPVCLTGGTATISATPDGNANVPAGYATAYVLTSGAGLDIVDLSLTAPSFEVTAGGDYTIHTLVLDPADQAALTAVSTGFDVNDLLLQGCGSICGSLDVTGAPITVNAPEVGATVADASTVCLDGGSADIGAESDGNEVVPAGYSVVYVLTDADNSLEILDANATGDFTVNAGGNYIIHTFVYDPVAVPDLAPFVGQSATVVVTAIGDGTICASLDVTGAPITVNAPEVGATVADASTVCLVGGSANIGAESDGNEVVPAGYTVVYVLTDADNGLEILDANATGDFTVTAGGNYIIHTFVYDPVAVPDLAPFVGQSATVVVTAIGDGTICAALDVTGAPITVDLCTGINEALVSNLSVYPNPSNGQFVIEVDGVEGDAQIVVTDVAGRQVYTEGVIMNASFRTEVNLNVATGTYLLQLVTVEGTVTRKIQID